MKASAPSGAIVFAATLITCAFAWGANPVTTFAAAIFCGSIAGLLALVKT